MFREDVIKVGLNAEDSYIVIAIYRLANEMNRRTNEICRKHRLTTGQFAVLESLYHKGDQTIGEVRDSVLSSNGTIPVIVSNLEKSGYLGRKKDSLDKRKTWITLTDEGRALIRQVYPENAERLSELLALWNKDEKRSLVRLLKRGAESMCKDKDKDKESR